MSIRMVFSFHVRRLTEARLGITGLTRRVHSGGMSTRKTRWQPLAPNFLSFFPTLSPSAPPHTFSPPLLPLCGQQAFSLLSAESAKHSHFWTADRLELADRVERRVRKRDIKDEGKGGEREEVSRGKITSHGKKMIRKRRCLFSPL